MSMGERLARLDERLLGGRTGVAVVLALITLFWADKGLDAASVGAWLVAIAMGALTVLTGQAAARTWRSRHVVRGAPVRG